MVVLQKTFNKRCTILLAAFLFSGCDSSGNVSLFSTASNALSGSVFDGPVKKSSVTVTDSNGDTVGTGVTGDDASFSISLSPSAKHPFQLSAQGGTDLLTGEAVETVMTSLVTDASQTTANISPMTTVIHKASVSRAGGDLSQVTKDDVAQVFAPIMSNFGFGSDSEESDFDPMTSPITDANVASFSMASEAMGEMVKRVAGTDSGNQDMLLAALAEDMADGNLDGQNNGAALTSNLPAGTSDAASMIAQVNIQSAMITVEVVSDTLEVTKKDGSKMGAATVRAAMAASMSSVVPTIDAETASKKLSTRKVSESLRDQGIAALETASSLVADNSALLALQTSFENLSVGEEATGQLNAGIVESGNHSLGQLDISVENGEISQDDIQRALNKPPKATKAIHQVTLDTSYSGTMLASDFNGDTLTYIIHKFPKDGTVSITQSGEFTYTPNAGFTGRDFFLFRVNDGSIDSNVAKVTLLVGAPTSENQTPITTDSEFTTFPGVITSGVLDGFDPDGDSLSFHITSNGTQGVVTIKDAAKGTFSYTSNTEATGTDSFSFSVSDSAGNTSETASVTVTFIVIDTDEDTIPDSADNCSLISNVNQVDTDGDGQGNVCDSDVDDDGNLATINVTVSANNDAPAIDGITDQITGDGVTTGPINFMVSDPDNDEGNLILSATSSNPNLIPNNSIILSGLGTDRFITATPVPSQTGTATITLSVNDGHTITTKSFLIDVLPLIQFRSTTQTVLRGQVATIVIRLSTTIDHDVVIPYSLSGAAEPGVDFSIFEGISPVIIPAGNLEATVALTVFDSSAPETDETMTLQFGVPSGAMLGGRVSHTLTIRGSEIDDAGGDDTGPSGGDDTGPSGGSGDDTGPSGGSGGDDTGPSGGGDDTGPSGVSSGDDTGPSGGSAGEDADPSGGGSGDDTGPSGGSAGEDAGPSGGGSGDDTGPSGGDDGGP